MNNFVLLVLGVLCSLSSGANTYFWSLFVGMSFLQVVFKGARVLTLLLVLESLMLFTSFSWATLFSHHHYSPQTLLMFFLISVSEACVGLSVLVALVRVKGKEFFPG